MSLSLLWALTYAESLSVNTLIHELPRRDLLGHPHTHFCPFFLLVAYVTAFTGTDYFLEKRVDLDVPLRETRRVGRVPVSVHHYAAVTGVVLAALGLGGALGLWYLKTGAIVLYLPTAAVLCYAGLVGSAHRDCPTIVGGLGALYMLSGGLLALAYELPSVPADHYDFWQSILRLTLGALSILAALYLPVGTSSSSSSS